MSTHEAKKIAKQYANALQKHRITFNRIYLFGSHATEKAKKYSDIDIAVVVKQIGHGKKYINKKMKLWELTPNIDTRIEPVLLEKKDFQKGMMTALAYEIKKHGVRIA